LVRLLQKWIQEALGADQELGLPENLYGIPEAKGGQFSSKLTLVEEKLA
jgi:hypothetical protein